MQADPRDWRTLPKFLLALIDSVRRKGGEDEPFQEAYVTHCHQPRCLIRFRAFDEHGTIFLIDSTDDDEHLEIIRVQALEFLLKVKPSWGGQLTPEMLSKAFADEET